MIPVRDEFYVTLLSNSSMDICYSNTQSRFQNHLKNPITLEGEWSVGITEFYHNAYDDALKTPARIMLYIHTDIISPRLVGDQCARIFRVIPTQDHEECIQFSHIEYMPVMNTCNMSSISIFITNEENQQPNFRDSTIPTMITLHFKRYK